MPFRHARAAALIGVLGAGLVVPPGAQPTHAAVRGTSDVTVRLTDIATLVPMRKIRGDRDFRGGPLVRCRLSLYISRDRRQLKARVHFRAEETAGDRSTVDEIFYETVYTAPAGRKIARILEHPSSEVTFRGGGKRRLGSSTEGAEALIADVAAVLSRIDQGLAGSSLGTRKARDAAAAVRRGRAFVPHDGDDVRLEHPPRGPVALFAIVGDTNGHDISEDRTPDDHTRIQSISFKRGFRLRLR
ncbi:MAG: hypothetical protein AAF721_26220 [Myxococcota bacterium]